MIWILNRKPDNPLKVISHDALKFRYLAAQHKNSIIFLEISFAYHKF